ncbi:peptidoglycan recognition protein family protein [Streptomyces sp. BSE6.1]|uniref:peptidoglycan recognition protein family protein n=1 Tax=Streptomyces sp. BSE6.1 TaxID=2605730 RepID=UPI001F23BDA0|nr:N-acetylmuramoyl-L-alanine amidase [Streptomyces sp. BSE6.1]
MATALTADRLLRALRAEGLTVVEVGDWRNHNRNSKGPFGPLHGVMIHHTVTKGSAATVDICRRGYTGLPGPLCHGVITKDGRVHLVGYGRANHAGLGDDDVLRAVIAEQPLPADNEANTDGNRHFYGFECENLGDGDDPWPAVQVDAIVRAATAISREHGWGERSTIGHLEWQPGKSDPRPSPGGADARMSTIRARIAERLDHSPDWDPTKEDDDMPRALAWHETKDREIVPRKWTTLPVEYTDLLTGAVRYDLMAQVAAVLPAGSTIQGRFYHLRPDGTRWTGPIIERPATDGNTFADFHNKGSIVATEKVRLEVAYYPAKADDDAPITISSAYVRGLYWT